MLLLKIIGMGRCRPPADPGGGGGGGAPPKGKSSPSPAADSTAPSSVNGPKLPYLLSGKLEAVATFCTPGNARSFSVNISANAVTRTFPGYFEAVSSI